MWGNKMSQQVYFCGEREKEEGDMTRCGCGQLFKAHFLELLGKWGKKHSTFSTKLEKMQLWLDYLGPR